MTARIKTELAVGVTDEIQAALETAVHYSGIKASQYARIALVRETDPRAVHAPSRRCLFGKGGCEKSRNYRLPSNIREQSCALNLGTGKNPSRPQNIPEEPIQQTSETTRVEFTNGGDKAEPSVAIVSADEYPRAGDEADGGRASCANSTTYGASGAESPKGLRSTGRGRQRGLHRMAQQPTPKSAGGETSEVERWQGRSTQETKEISFARRKSAIDGIDRHDQVTDRCPQQKHAEREAGVERAEAHRHGDRRAIFDQHLGAPAGPKQVRHSRARPFFAPELSAFAGNEIRT